MSLISSLSVLALISLAVADPTPTAASAFFPMSTANGTSIPNGSGAPGITSTANATTTHPTSTFQISRPTSNEILNCAPTKGLTLPGGTIESEAEGFCKSIDGKVLSEDTYNFNQTNTFEGKNRVGFEGLLLDINYVQGCSSTLTLLAAGCTSAFSSILSQCAPTATASQKYGGKFTAYSCVQYGVAMETGTDWDAATAPVSFSTSSLGTTAPPISMPTIS